MPHQFVFFFNATLLFLSFASAPFKGSAVPLNAWCDGAVSAGLPASGIHWQEAWMHPLALRFGPAWGLSEWSRCLSCAT